MNPKNNRGINQRVLHFWSKFGDSSFNPLRAKFFRENINIYLHVS